MEFKLWFQSQPWTLIYPQSIGEMTYLLAMTALTLWLLFGSRKQFRLPKKKLLLFLLLLALLLSFNRFAVLRAKDVRGWLTVAGAFVPYTPTLSLAALFIVALVALLFGEGPGLVAGLLAGLMMGHLIPLPLGDIFAWGLLGWTSGYLFHQRYREAFFRLLRLPIVALPVAVFLAFFVISLGFFVAALPGGTLAALDNVLLFFHDAWLVWMVGPLGVGLLLTLLSLVLPGLRPRPETLEPSLFSRSLRARFMLLLIPLLLLGLIGSVLAVTDRSIYLAESQKLMEMERSAESVQRDITYFHYTASNLMKQFADEPALLDPARREAALEFDRNVLPLFQELLLVDAQGKVVASVPPGLSLVGEETAAVQKATGVGIASHTHLMEVAEGEYRFSFVEPVGQQADGSASYALIGRADPVANPTLRGSLASMEGGQGSSRTGFIVDDRNLIIIHRDPAYLLHPWAMNNPSSIDKPQATEGELRVDLSPQGQRILTYSRHLDGVNYEIILQVPFLEVLEFATVIANPLLLAQLSLGFLLLLTVPFLASRITRPLHTLAEAAGEIAQGRLDRPVHISGDDEVAQLGRAFEQMRLRLQDRLNDLSLLLRISQSISASLHLAEGMPIILRGAMEESAAETARFLLLDEQGEIRQVFAEGQADAAYPGLDRMLARALVRRRSPLVVNDLERQRLDRPVGPLRSFAAIPARLHGKTVGLLWAGSTQPGTFDEARVSFLSTLSTHAALLVEKARLFQSAEGGRRRLAAILSSTTDAILVTDEEGKLLLINPAAQSVFGLGKAAYGQPITQLPLPEPLVEALRPPYDEQRTPPTVELPLPDGRTFYASIAPILTGDDRVIGRVAVMRDVTHFKELDEMKSEFVATVSHDLRAPLTFIRGYASMLPMVGELSEKQESYLDRILEGIDQMSALIEDLLNLRRIEAGVGIKHEPCNLGLILIEAVDSMRARAAANGLVLRLEPSEGSVTITGDHTLLRQAIGNLVDNAIKYTPSGGEVSVGLEVDEARGEVIIHVHDTGIGIAPEDQLRLFEKFYRIRRRETGNVPGTGLGLALVRSIIERHGGRVWVESELNKGSTFYIALPLRTEEEEG